MPSMEIDTVIVGMFIWGDIYVTMALDALCSAEALYPAPRQLANLKLMTGFLQAMDRRL